MLLTMLLFDTGTTVLPIVLSMLFQPVWMLKLMAILTLISTLVADAAVG